MPVDPDISLAVRGGSAGMMQAGGGLAPLNPLETLNSVAGTMERLNNLKLFNAQFAAKQKAGKILAAAPSLEDGIATLQQDPDVSWAAPQIANDAIVTRNGILQANAAEQKLGFDAFSNVLAGMPAVIKADPQDWDSQWQTLKDNTLTMTSPVVRDRVAKSIDNLKTSMSDKTPEQRQQLMVGWAAAGGFGPAAQSMFGAQHDQQRGDTVVSGIVAPPEGGPNGEKPGAFKEGSRNALGLAPQVANPDGTVVGGKYGSGASGGGASNGLALPTPSKPSDPAPATGRAPPSGPRMSFLGTPLFDEKTEMKAPPAVVRNIAGNPTGAEGQRVQALMKDFTENGKDEYKAANTLEGQVSEMNSDIDTMAKNGGWLVPGSGAELRFALGKLKSTVEAATGSAPDLDTEKTAKAEDLNKVTQRMAATLINTMYGQQREAAETIRNITEKGVPGISNSLMGSKLILSVLDAAAKRSKEQYEWDNEWASRNNGDLRQADVEFNKKFPAKAYIAKAVQDIGMDQSGGFTPEGLQTAYRNHLLTEEQYRNLLLNKGKAYKKD